MPRNVRNSWVNLSVSGRRSIATGPAAKDGEMSAQFYVRHNGNVTRSVSVSCFADGDDLTLVVNDPDGKPVYAHHTKH